MLPGGAAEDDAPRDVDEIGGRHEITEDEKELGHGFAREDIARKKDTWKNGEKGELHGLCLRIGFAGDQDAKRKRNKNVWQGKDGEKNHATVDRHAEDKTHKGQDHA